MKKFILLFIVYLFVHSSVKADHITGGEMYYTFMGETNGMYHYKVTAKFYKDCRSSRQLINPTTVSVFEKGSGTRIKDISVALIRNETLTLNNPDKCITNPPPVCYEVGYYEFDVSLPGSVTGYIMTAQVVYRVSGINNLYAGYNNIGATYTAEIPATTSLNGAKNNSARFVGNDLIVICANNAFNYNFTAADDDGDELQYSLCDAYQGGFFGGANNSVPPAGPPYQSVPYGPPYSGSKPLGNNVKIDSKTGYISGIAPVEGIYVITVCVQEIRGGKIIATQRKDLQINISPCTIAAATIKPEYTLCKESMSVSISNFSNSSLIKTYNWNLVNSKGDLIFSTDNSSLNYTFSDTGRYSVSLQINKNESCSDSASSSILVYPHFNAKFNYKGICFTKPTSFTDGSTTVYGQIASWNWNFGEAGSSNNVSVLPNPVHTFSTNGTKVVQLIINNTNGCIDTALNNVPIFDKPPIDLLFKDTVICIKDAVELKASGDGVFSWTPDNTIVAANTATPLVHPLSTTVYYVQLNSDGCINTDSVTVRVVDKVHLKAMSDTTICSGDELKLNISSDGFQYAWLPANTLNDPTLKTPTATANFSTTYQVTAYIGSCVATDNVTVNTVPYPTANAGKDTVICYDNLVQLEGSSNGKTFSWTPSEVVYNPQVLKTAAKPTATTLFILSAYDNKGCPKPGMDSVLVRVLPPIQAFAGNDTSVIVGQPLQLQATGGSAYIWQPSTGLSAQNISNPVANYTSSSEEMQYKVRVYNEAGCSEEASIKVKIFSTAPTVFVPTAFTPNRDGKNDLAAPLAVGIIKIKNFSIFNRWGQLVFTTTTSGIGWDGNLNGKPQSSGTYIWMVQAQDFNGKHFTQKGFITLIR